MIRAIVGPLLAAAALLRLADAGASAPCPGEAKRVVALGGAVTEIVYALGEGHRLVGVDTTSQHPPEAADLPDVGYYRQVAAEGLLSLGPDLVLADADAGPASTLEQAAAAGVCIVRTVDGGTPASIAERVRAVAEALDVTAEGERLAADITARLEVAARAAAAAGQRPRVLFVLSVQGGAPVVAGRDTEAEAIIALAGGVNAADGFDGYKPLTPEAAIVAAPDVVLMMEHVVEQVGGTEAVFSIPALRLTPAGESQRLVAMNGLLLLGFGPRTPEAVDRLRSALSRAPTTAAVR